MPYVLSLFLLLSGIASLTYQVTWVRLLGLSMGATSASISTVLAAFFLGLALGSYFAERLSRNRIDSLAIYIALEAVIGVAGLLSLPVLLNLDWVMGQVPGLGASLPAKFLVAMIILVIPTICMGATFPVMAAIAIRRRNEIGRGLGHLYSVNTAGAVLGAGLSGFVFIPSLGLDGAIYIAFALNLTVVAIAAAVNRNLRLPPLEVEQERDDSADAAHSEPGRALRFAALTALFVTGLVSIATEVGWAKYLSIFTGTTIYGFAAILTVFLIGIAGGAWAIRSYLERMRAPALWMVLGLIGLGGALLLTRAGLTLVPDVYGAINQLKASAPVVHGVKYAFVFLLLIVPTLLFGALFPLNLKLYCGGLHGVRARVGRAYAVNTVAGIAGSLIAGFWLIPVYGTDVLLLFCAILVLALPLLFLPALAGPVARAAVVVCAIVVAAAGTRLPPLDYARLIASVGYTYDDDVQKGRKPDVLFLKEGKASVISVVTYDGVEAKVQSNGLNESIVHLTDLSRGLISEQLLGLLPYFLVEAPRSAFVVGFGGGITTRALGYTDLQSIRVVELEPAVVDAGRAIAKGEVPVLTDKRVRLEYNDARNTLLLDSERYDIIVSQPSHPWVAGAANVFTKEFFAIAKSRLNEGGVYGQWVNLFNMDATTLRALFKAFYDVFPEGVTFANLRQGDYLMFGSERPLRFDYERIAQRMNSPRIVEAFAHHDITTPEDLLWYFALSRREIVALTADSRPNTDTNILSEVRLSRLIEVPTGEENPYDYLTSNFSFDLAPYLAPDEVVERLYSVGRAYVRWDAPDVVRSIAQRLQPLDEMRARALRHELLWNYDRFNEATALYEQHAQWPGHVHRHQSTVYAALERFDDAHRAVALVEDEVERRIARAYVMFRKRDWSELRRLKPLSDEERRLHLLGVAQYDARAAGAALLRMDMEFTRDIPVLRVLVRYFGELRDDTNMQAYARKLSEATRKEIDRLLWNVDRAVEEKNAAYMRTLIGEIERVAADAPELTRLRKRYEKLIEESAPSARVQSDALKS